MAPALALEKDALSYREAVTIQQAQHLTGLSARTIRHAIQCGALKAVRPPGTRAWRLPSVELQKWLQDGHLRTEGKK